MNINVAAICKNEEKFIERFLEHVSKADRICIVDTGSTDSTIELIDAWCKANPDVKVDFMQDTLERDLSRSRSLAASVFDPNELCVWLDIDEHFSDPDWIKRLKEKDIAGPVYIMMYNGDSKYFQMKGYFPSQASWKYAAHEVLMTHANMPVTYIEDFHTNHTPDYDKPRNYLPELARDAIKYPHDERASFYYCRELCYDVSYRGGNIDEAQSEYRRLMALNPWDDYKALASIELTIAQFVADQYVDTAAIYAAIAARSDRIEPFGTGAFYMYQAGDNVTALSLAIQGIARADTTSNFLFSSVPTNLKMCLDVARYACFNLGLFDKAVFYHVQLCQTEGTDPMPWINERELTNKVKANGKNEETDATS